MFALLWHIFHLHVFKYLTFRAAGALATSLLFVAFFGPDIILALRIKQGKGQPIRQDGPQGHLLTKKGTPTMGGLIILAGLILSTLLWADIFYNPYIWIVLFVTTGFGLIGFYDDYLKVSKQNVNGFAGRWRLILEMAIAGLACLALLHYGGHNATKLAFPFLKGYYVDLGWFYVIFGAIVIVASGNAVNLTDGLDGLAIVPCMIAGGTFAIIAHLAGNFYFSGYLVINFVQGSGELSVVCAALIGAGLGFLWFNAPPAQIFMGDTGSLALGGLLGAVAVISKQEILLLVVGGLFALEALSVIVQVGSFKLTGKRVFRMAPIHHHFEALGWSEPQIVMRFWIIAFVLGLMGLSTLKLR